MEYIYLLQEREFVRSGEQTYKIGRTSQANPDNRLKQYPKNSSILTVCAVNDSVAVEKLLKKRFAELFDHRSDYGSEYFNGDVGQMQIEIYKVVVSQINTYVEDSDESEEYESFEEQDNVEDEEDNIDTPDVFIEESEAVTTVNSKKVTKNTSKFHCGKCGKGFAEKRYLNQHKNRKTPCNSTFMCDKCHKLFPNNYEFTRHMNRKTSCVPEEVPVEDNRCDICDVTYSSKSNLKRHQKTCKIDIDKYQMQLELNELKEKMDKLMNQK